TGPQGKIGGAAQARKPRVVLHHTTIAYEMSNDQMRRVLRIGREKLSNKGIPSAVKTVSPLRQHMDLPRVAVVGRLVEGFRRRFGLTDDTLTAEEIQQAEQLVCERYGTKEWTYDLP